MMPEFLTQADARLAAARKLDSAIWRADSGHFPPARMAVLGDQDIVGAGLMLRRYLARRKMRWAVREVRDIRAKKRLGHLMVVHSRTWRS
jgi:hypothetical protein